MKLSLWRSKVLTWLQSQVTVDSWLLNEPDQPGQTVGFLPPLKDLAYRLNNLAEIAATATQEFYIIKSYEGNLKYSELPIAALEGYYQTLAIRIAHDYKDITDEILDLELLQVPNPVNVREAGDERRDWVLELYWAFQFTFMATPEIGQIQPPYVLNKLNLGLYRSKLENFEDKVLDFTFSKQRNS